MLPCSVDIFVSAAARAVSKIEKELAFVLISAAFVEIPDEFVEMLLELLATVPCNDETLLEFVDTAFVNVASSVAVAVPVVSKSLT